MTEQPAPPTGPPPGWYDDPSGSAGLRWWDGYRWTEAVHSLGQPAAGLRPLMPLGQWLSQAFRFSLGRAGHFLPLIVLLIVPGYLILSTSLWYGLYDLTMVTDRTSGTIRFENGRGFTPSLLVALVAVVVLVLLFRLLYGAACHQADHPADGWSASLRVSLARWPRLTAVLLGRWLIYLVLFAGWSVLAVVSPFFVLLFPVAVGIAVVVWVRCSLAGVPAALGRTGRWALADSWAVTGGRFAPVVGRQLALTVVGASMFMLTNMVGSVLAAVSGGQPADPVDPFAERIPFDQLLPSNPASLAVNWLFLALGAGAWQVLSAVGHTLLYADIVENPAEGSPAGL